MNSIMFCKDVEIEIPINEPFKNDRLNRQRLANNLTLITTLFAETGAVLAIDGDWGTGKTTFINMWQQQLTNGDYKCILFNAWKCDFQEDPFIALMSELKETLGNNEKIKEVIASGAKILTKAGGEIIRGLLQKFAGIDTESIKVTSDEIIDQCYEKIDNYQKTKTSLNEFRDKLAEFVASESGGKPVYFFIDELDRCNPHFAVKLLERVKHLFEVPNIIFVLAVNIEQLQYAIQGFYGSSNINGREYLKRFIDYEYSLPEPNVEEYCTFLYEQYGLKDFYESDIRKYDNNLKGASTLFLDIAITLLTESHLNLRKINRLFAINKLALTGFNKHSQFASDVLFILSFLKETNTSVYKAIMHNEFSIQELINVLETILPDSLFRNNDSYIQHRIAYTIASLICRYNRFDGSVVKDPNFINQSVSDGDNPSFPITCSKLSLQHLNKALSDYSKEMQPGYSLSSIFEAIELANYIHIN